MFYNPGRWLERNDISFEETNFLDILKKSNWLVLNRGEASRVQKNMHLGRIEGLFDASERLELIIVTRDKNGSYIYERRGQKRWNYVPREILSVNPGQALGAGDAYAATFLSKMLTGSKISDAQTLASIAAEEALSYVGSLNQRKLGGASSVSELVTEARFSRPCK